jgi:hypothetical protein
MSVAQRNVARLKRTTFPERVCVALFKVARLYRTIFYECVCGAVESGASAKNHYPRTCLWRDKTWRFCNERLFPDRFSVALFKVAASVT